MTILQRPLNRRRFLQLSIASVGGLATSRLLASERRSLGAQLYTVRKEAERDLPAVLEAIRKIGYTKVETYWDIYGHPAAELRRMINDHGLEVLSGHFNYDGLDSKTLHGWKVARIALDIQMLHAVLLCRR